MKPLLLTFASEVKSDPKNLFTYDHNLGLNMIKINKSKKTFIEITQNDIESLTKTKVAREREDNHLNLLEFGRKTEVRRERDTEYLCLLELQTKTFVKREQDE